MNTSRLDKSRFIVGIALVTVAALMFLFFRETITTAGAIAIAVLALVSIAVSKKR
jgi:hypothetical protein